MKYFLYLIIITISGIVFSSCVKDGETDFYETINYVETGDPVPSFTVSDENGNTFHSSGFNGKRSLLVLFTTGCPDCERILPSINNKIWEEIKNDPGYLLVNISRDESAETVANYWKENQFTMPRYLDPGRKVFSLFANQTIPRLYIIDEEGTIEWRATEKLPVSIDELIGLIKQP